MCYPSELPKQKECRLDWNHANGHSFPLLIDTNDETVIFVGSYPDRTLTEVYKSMLYAIKYNMGIDTFITFLTSKKFKKFSGVLYK